MSDNLPTFDAFIDPLFGLLADRPDGVSTSDAYQEVADTVGLTDQQRQEVLPSGSQPVYQNRIGWAHDRLKRANLSHSKAHGVWQLTEDGHALAEAYPDGLPDDLVEEVARPRSNGFELAEHLTVEQPSHTPADEPADSEPPAEDFTALEAAKIVLADAGEPLHYRKITERILDQGHRTTESDTPPASIVSALSVDIKEASPPTSAGQGGSSTA